MVRTLPSHSCGTLFDPCSRNQDPTGRAVLSEGKKKQPEFSSLVAETVKKKKKNLLATQEKTWV